MVSYRIESGIVRIFWAEEMVYEIKEAFIPCLSHLQQVSSKEELLLRLEECEDRAGKKLLISMLARRGLFYKQAEKKLAEQGLSLLAQGRILTWAMERGLLCDDEMIDTAVRGEFRRGKGLFALQKKIAPWHHIQVTRELQQQEEEALFALLHKKTIDPQSLSLLEKQKLYRVLQRKGFSVATIQKVLFLLEE